MRYTSLLVLTLLIGACGGHNQTTSSASTDTPPFSVWKEMRLALRTSPDDLAAQADKAVASKDPHAVFRFVRDKIRLVPSEENGFGEAASMMRWGPDAALRYGAATPRGKAELLAQLLRRQGRHATVVTGHMDWGSTNPASLLAASPPEYAPKIDATTWKRWFHELGFTGTPPVLPAPDPHGSRRTSLASRLLALLPADLAAKGFDTSLRRVPLVRVGKDFANPLRPDAVYGKSYTTDDPENAPPAEWQHGKVSVALSVTSLRDPGKRQTLVKGTWPLKDVLGRRIVVSTTPAYPIDVLADMRVKDVNMFYPVLAVHGAGLSAKDALALAKVGDVRTLAGDVISGDATHLVVNGQPIVVSKATSAAAASVAKLTVSADASRFPDVYLTVDARDASGKAVQGLRGGDFSVSEQGANEPLMLLQNAAPHPRVLIILDESDSIPADFVGKKAAEFVRSLAKGVRAINPDAQFLVAGMGTGLGAMGAWTQDPDTVKAEALKVMGGGFSDLWTALASAGAYKASVIAFVTDGEATDTRGKALDDEIRLGPPAVMIGVGKVNSRTLKHMASLTGGTATSVRSQTQASNAVVGFLKAAHPVPYILRYRAQSDGPHIRKVRLTVPAASRDVRARYHVPSSGSTLIADNRIAGLFLTISVDGKSVTRLLGGFDYRNGGKPTQADVDDVRQAFFGSEGIAVEGSHPTVSAWIDDVLADKLAAEPLWRAKQAGDYKKMKHILESQPLGLPPPVVWPMLPPLGTASAPVFDMGPRMILYQQRLVGTHMQRKLDVLPFTRFAGASSDGRQRFKQTLTASLALAIRESALFTTSTASALKGKRLAVLAPYQSVGSVMHGLGDQARQRWSALISRYEGNYNIVPTNGTPVAFWSVDPDTGTTLGILADGSGGGSTTDPDQITYNSVSRAFSIMGMATGWGGMGFAMGGFVAYGKAVSQIAMLEGMAVEKLDASDFSKKAKGVIDGFKCDLIKGAVGEMNPITDFAANVDATSEAVTGSSLPCN